MSGTSRIGGYGGNFGRDHGSGRSASLVRFCRGRRQGDIVAGTFLRIENDTHGWALLEGEELLAQLPADGPKPVVGAQVFFRIESLVPDVILRMLPNDDPDARLSFSMPSLPLAQEAALYIAARDKFDGLLAARKGRGWNFPVDASLARRKNIFIDLVAKDPVLFASFAETLARSKSLGHAASGSGLIFFQHMPWLSRAVTGIEVSLWSKGESPLFAAATLPTGDRLLLRGAVENEILRYRVKVLSAKGGSGVLPGNFAPVHSAMAEYKGQEREIFGAPNASMDIVGRILALVAGSGTMATGRFSRTL